MPASLALAENAGLAPQPDLKSFRRTNRGFVRLISGVHPPKAKPPVSPSPLLAPAGWPLRILYADDLPELRTLMRDRLALDGHQVETASDGEAALARLTPAPDRFHLIIADHNMPRVDGLDLVWHVRRLPYAGKIIILSSELSPALEDRYRRFGVDLLVHKPIFPPTFCLMLHQLFHSGHPLTGRPAGVTETGPAALPRAATG